MSISGGNVTLDSCNIYGNTANIGVSCTPALFSAPLNSSDRPLPFAQGGMYVSGGTVTLDSCNIYENTADGVSRPPTLFNAPLNFVLHSLTVFFVTVSSM